MPRDGNQVYAPPAGTTAIPNTPVSSAAYNNLVADLTADLNLPRPVEVGGTGATTANGAREKLGGTAFQALGLLAAAPGSFVRYDVATGNGAAMQSIVGTVTRNGVIPTGALIERGSNSNGTFFKFAGGLQVCWHSFDESAVNWTTANGGGFIRSAAITWVYPSAFSVVPFTVAMVQRNSTDRAGLIHVTAQDAASVGLLPWVTVSSNGSVAKTVLCAALGVWH